MNIQFASRKMEAIVTNERLRQKKYGQLSRLIASRLAELEAANSLAEIPEGPPPRRHKLTGDFTNCWSVSISQNYRIILSPIGEYDKTVLSSITEVEILDICDYH